MLFAVKTIGESLLKRKKSFYLKAVASILFLVVLFKFIQGRELLKVLSQLNLSYFFISLLIGVMIVIVTSLRWKMLLIAQGTPLPFLKLLKIYYIGYYFSNLLPSNFGGDVVRAICTGESIGSQSRAAVSVLAERVIGLIMLQVLAIIFPFFGGKSLYTHPAIYIPAIMSAGGLIILSLVLRFTRPVTSFFSILRKIFSLLSGKHNSQKSGWQNRIDALLVKLEQKAETFHDKWDEAVKALKQKPILLVYTILLTMLHYVLMWLNVYYSLRAFDVVAPIWYIALVLPHALFVAMIPITLGSIGIAESSYVFYFGLIGVHKPSVLAMAFLLRLKMILNGFVGFALYMRYGDERIKYIAENNITERNTEHSE